MLGRNPMSPELAGRWLEYWLPSASEKTGERRDRSSQPPTFQEFQRSLEEWWSVLGVVPRYRYTELLRQYEELKERLEKAEETVRHLRRLLAEEGRSVDPEARDMLSQWEEMTKRTLEAQTSWASIWLPETEDDSKGD